MLTAFRALGFYGDDGIRRAVASTVKVRHFRASAALLLSQNGKKR